MTVKAIVLGNNMCRIAINRTADLHASLGHADHIGSRGSTNGNSNTTICSGIRVDTMHLDHMKKEVMFLHGHVTLRTIDPMPFP